jgi:hypothetical protein
MASRYAHRWLTLRRFDSEVRRLTQADLICGADEVGRGPLAGPLVAAAVCFPIRTRLPGLDDSKNLDPGRRAELDVRIREVALGVGWSFVGPRGVDRMNPHRASLFALRRAVLRVALRVPVAHVLVDGAHRLPDLPLPQDAVVDGAIIWPNGRISRNAAVKDCILGRHCHVGRDVVIEGGAVLGDKSAVTDFSRLTTAL